MKTIYLCTVGVALLAMFASASAQAGAKVQVCHFPPGDPGDYHTITVSERSLQDHLDHGDLENSCLLNAEEICGDGDYCTIDMDPGTEVCLDVGSRPPVNCNDGNWCTDDSCDPALGCLNITKRCEDGDMCTIDSCDRNTGGCVHAAVVCQEGEVCDPARGCIGVPTTACPCFGWEDLGTFGFDLPGMETVRDCVSREAKTCNDFSCPGGSKYYEYVQKDGNGSPVDFTIIARTEYWYFMVFRKWYCGWEMSIGDNEGVAHHVVNTEITETQWNACKQVIQQECIRRGF